MPPAKSGFKPRGKRWRLAPALVQLMTQIDAQWPGRATVSDGSIASDQHTRNNPNSDHEPKVFSLGPEKKTPRWVTAVDITHDKEKGVDCSILFETLRKHKDIRIKYVIFNGEIYNSPGFNTAGARARGPWRAGKYSGYSKHRHHIHISVWPEHGYSKLPWLIGSAAQAQKSPPMKLRREDGTPVDEPPKQTDPTFSEKQELALLGIGASPNSLAYTVRFYRQIASKAPGLDGSKPEQVADWLLDQIGVK